MTNWYPNILIVFLLLSLNLKAQEKQNIISGNILGASSAIGLSYERLVNDKLSFELGFGLIGIGAGFTIYPGRIRPSKVCFYSGIKLSSFVLVDVGGGTVAYIPLGFTFFSRTNWLIAFDLGPANGKLVSSSFGGNTSETTRFYVYGNLKIGLRF